MMIEKVLTRVRGITPGIKRVLTGIRQMPLSLAHKVQHRASLLWSKVAQAPKGAVHAVARRRSGILHALVGMLGLSLMLVGAFGIAAVRYGMSLFERVNLGQLDIQPIVVRIADTAEVGLSISIGLVVAGLVLALGASAGFKSLLRSPVTTYRKLIRGRDWLLAFVGRLQAESQKWKTTFNIMKLPYSVLLKLGFSPQMAIGLLAVGGTAGGGVIVNETILAEKSFSNRDPGIYAASVVGQDANLNIPTEYVEGSNTLRIDLGSTPVREITIQNVSVGTVFTGSALPSGEQNVVQVSGNTISGGTNTRLEIGHFVLENSRCKKLELTDIQAHTIIVRGNASDGQSIAPSPGTSRMRAIGGGHQQADAMTTNGGTYDRIWIQAPSSGVNGKIGKLTLSNLYTKGGDCVFSKLSVGTMEILLNEVGVGDGFATKEFVIATTVTGANITIEDNVEVTIAEPATS